MRVFSVAGHQPPCILLCLSHIGGDSSDTASTIDPSMRRAVTRWLDNLSICEAYRDLIRTMLKEDCPDRIPISRYDSPGVPVVSSDWDMPYQILDTWYGGLPGYRAALSTILAADSSWADLWDSDARWAQFLGKDCVFSHAVLYPLMLAASGRQDWLPDEIHMNGWYTLNGLKFSTSRQHAIWAHDFLSDYGPLASRIYLTATAPDVDGGNFEDKKCLPFVTDHLAYWYSWLRNITEDNSLSSDLRLTGWAHDAAWLLHDKWATAMEGADFSIVSSALDG